MSDAGLEQKRKFFLVDDHVMLRFGMVNFIKSNGWDCAGEAGSAAETVQKMEALDLLGGGRQSAGSAHNRHKLRPG